MILARLGEGGRVCDDHAKTLACAHHAFQSLQGLGLLRFHAISDAIALRRFKGEHQCRFAAVKQCDMRGTSDGRGNTKTARVAKGVQNRRTLGQPRYTGAMFALIKEPAGFLPTQRINREGKPAFLHRDHPGFAMQQLGFFGQAFQRTHGAVIARNHHAGRDQRVQCFQN